MISWPYLACIAEDATPLASQSAGIAPIEPAGAIMRVQATGVGAPSGFSTVTIASPIPSDCSVSARSYWLVG